MKKINIETFIIILLAIVSIYLFTNQNENLNKINTYKTNIKQKKDSILILNKKLVVNNTKEIELNKQIDVQKDNLIKQKQKIVYLENKFTDEIEVVNNLTNDESINLLNNNLSAKLEIIRDSNVVLKPLHIRTINKVFLEKNQGLIKISYLKKINKKTDELNTTLINRITNDDEKINLLDNKIKNKNKIINNSNDIIKEKDKIIKKNKIKYLLTGGGIGAGIILILSIL